MSSRPLVVLGALGVLVAGCGPSSPHSRDREAAPVLMYTCCTASTVHRVYRPGDVVPLRWVRSTGDQGRDTGAETLSARLDGPFRGVAQAKAPGALGPVQATAHVIKVAPGDSTPVSRIQIPADATPGLYNVTATDVEGPGTLRTTTTIRVVAAGS